MVISTSWRFANKLTLLVRTLKSRVCMLEALLAGGNLALIPNAVWPGEIPVDFMLPLLYAGGCVCLRSSLDHFMHGKQVRKHTIS